MWLRLQADDCQCTPGEKLLHDGQHLVVHAVARADDDDGQVLVHQRERPVLHLARQDTLAVHQGHLLHLRKITAHTYFNTEHVHSRLVLLCSLALTLLLP